jgi:hypothetical protein
MDSELSGVTSGSSLKGMAGTTRLELATSAVTGQRSNQLNYVPAGDCCERMVGSAGLEPATSCL